jgi:uncharacterized membrane protein YccC
VGRRRQSLSATASNHQLPDERELVPTGFASLKKKMSQDCTNTRGEGQLTGELKLPDVTEQQKLSLGDVIYALAMAIACAISYWVMMYGLAPFVDRDSDFLGGMWAVVATVFVFRDTRAKSISAGFARLIATCVSFALCLFYLLLFPSQPLGLAALIGIGTLVMIVAGRREDIITTGITTAVVMVVAAMSPHNAWREPLLRLVDTIVGIAVGIGCMQIASFLLARKRAR